VKLSLLFRFLLRVVWGKAEAWWCLPWCRTRRDYPVMFVMQGPVGRRETSTASHFPCNIMISALTPGVGRDHTSVPATAHQFSQGHCTTYKYVRVLAMGKVPGASVADWLTYCAGRTKNACAPSSSGPLQRNASPSARQHHFIDNSCPSGHYLE
jgi:hypothetical protein